PRRPVVLVVFAMADEFVRFWPRFNDLFGYPEGVAKAAGIASMGVGTTWYNPQWRMLDICVHEATHALTTQMLGLAGGASWLSEGIAERYEPSVVAGRDLRAEVRRQVADGKLELPPLEQLLSGAPTPCDRYLPAALVIDWLLADPLRRAQLPAVLEDMWKTGTTDLRPLVERRLGMPMAELEERWRS